MVNFITKLKQVAASADDDFCEEGFYWITKGWEEAAVPVTFVETFKKCVPELVDVAAKYKKAREDLIREPLLHGDQSHRIWLESYLEAHFEDVDKALAALRQKVEGSLPELATKVEGDKHVCGDCWSFTDACAHGFQEFQYGLIPRFCRWLRKKLTTQYSGRERDEKHSD